MPGGAVGALAQGWDAGSRAVDGHQMDILAYPSAAAVGSEVGHRCTLLMVLRLSSGGARAEPIWSRTIANTPVWAWSAPLGVLAVMRVVPGYMVLLMVATIAVGVVVFVGRRPVGAIKVLLVLMPFHQALFAGLYSLGVPAGLVRPMGQWKEGLIVGLLVAAARQARRERHRLDWLDGVALAYVTLGSAYVMLPGLFVAGTAGASLDLSTRLIGWRTDVLYVALFLAARHLRLDAAARRSITRAFLLTAVAVSAIAYFEYAFQDLWNTIWLDWLDLPYYKLDVLRVTGDPNIGVVQSRTIVAGRDLLRAGSVFLLPFALGCYGALAVAVLADRIVRGAARRAHYVALVVICGAVLLTVTRTAIFALAVVLVATVFRRSERSFEAARPDGPRVRFVFLLVLVAALALPVAARIGVADRFAGKDDYSSNDDHRSSSRAGYATLLDEPLGRGLATAAGAGQRANVSGVLITESQFLQIGNQLGVLGLILWLLVCYHLMRALGAADRRAPPETDRDLLSGARVGLLALVLAGSFLQIFIEFSLSWATWMLAGLALGAVERDRAAAGSGAGAELRGEQRFRGVSRPR